jgi:hypothetical protein
VWQLLLGSGGLGIGTSAVDLFVAVSCAFENL